MNGLIVGIGDKTDELLRRAEPPFLLIDDGPIAAAFKRYFKTKAFDIAKHTFNPLRDADYKRLRDIVAAFYTVSPEGENTLTVRNGKRAFMKLLMQQPTRFDKLPRSSDPATEEAIAMVDDALLSPVLKHVLCGRAYFKFEGSVVVVLDRTEIADKPDALLLASLLIGQHQGQIIIPDFGFYGRPFHMSLIRQDRLLAGVNTLTELPPQLRQAVMLIDDKVACHATWEDAEALARYTRHEPGTVGHSEFLDEATQA